MADSNDAPTVANAISDQNATEDALFVFAFAANTFEDVDVGDSVTFSATKADGSALPGWLMFTATTRTFSGTPRNGDVGTLSVKVTATDGDASVSDTFHIVVGNTNDAPTLAHAIPDQNATEFAAFTFAFAANTFADVDASDSLSLSYSATKPDGSLLPSWLTFTPATRRFSGTPLNTDVGTLSVKVTATDGSNASISDTFHLVVAAATNLPSLSISNRTVTEATTSTVNAVFRVTLSAASLLPVTVTFATAEGTATAGTDYQTTNGTITFAPGQKSQFITVPVTGDLLDEESERFLVNLSGAINARISDGQGQGTILNDDPKPKLSINDVTVTEGTGSTVEAVFTVMLSAASGRPVSVAYKTSQITALAPDDFGSAEGLLSFAPGETIKQISVSVAGDARDERNEMFFVNLSTATNARITDRQGIGTIADDDATPTLSINGLEKGSGAVLAVWVNC